MLDVYEFVDRKKIIKKFAKEMARLQKKADKYYYIENNKEMADFNLIYATEVKELAIRLGIYNEVYQEALTIYNFKESGKKEYKPSQEQLEELRNWYDIPPVEPKNF